MALFTLYLRYHHHPEGDEVGTETILLFLQIFIKHLVLPGTTGGFPGGSDCKVQIIELWASWVAQTVKQLPAMRSPGSIPGSGTSLEKGMATHSSVLAWEILWTEERGKPQSMELQRVGHD